MEFSKSIADFALNYLDKLGVSYAEVRLEHASVNGFILKNGIPQVSGFDRITGLGMRFVLNKTLGFVSSNNLNKEKIKHLIERAVKITKKASRINEEINLSEEPIHKKTYEVKQKIKLEDVDVKEKIGILEDAERLIAETKVKVPGRYFSLSDSVTTEYLITSEGTKITATIPKTMFFYFLTIKNGNKTAQRYWQYGNSAGFESVKEWNIPNLMQQEVKSMDNVLKRGIKPPKERIDIVTAPQVVGIMVHESVGHPYEADRILGREAAQAGESFITKDMLNHRISEIVNVVDDPTLPNSYGYYLFDNEGVEARRKFLIKDGRINEFLHNRQTSAVMGLRSNGCSRAVDYDKESIVRMSNTFLLPGDYSEDELIEGVKLGVYMKNFMEWNIDDKRLNQKYMGAEAYLIKNGELKEPVINPTIEITTTVLWKKVDAIANNIEYHAGNCGKGEPMQPIPVWFGGPSIRLRNIRLSQL
jgi:TldD protein